MIRIRNSELEFFQFMNSGSRCLSFTTKSTANSYISTSRRTSKVKFTLERVTKVQCGSRVKALFFPHPRRYLGGGGGGGLVSSPPRPRYPRKRPGTHFIGGWVGPKAGLDGCGKSRPHHSVASRYTNYATPTQVNLLGIFLTQWL